MTLRHFFVLLALLGVPVFGQWLNYPTASVPRTKDGKPDLSAPAPRTADGKPDLSGIWDIEHNRPCPPVGCNDMLVGLDFFDIGWTLKGGLPYQPWARDAVKTRTAQAGAGDPTSRCLPGGLVKMLTTPLFKKIVQTPGLVIMLSEMNAQYRQIFTDGRPLPRDPNPSWGGYSSGKWDGDTLVVESNGFRDGVWLDRNGNFIGEGATITEQYRRLNVGKMEIEITVNDPKTYAAPWTIKMNQFLMADTDLMDYICQENEKDAQHLGK